MESPPPRLRVNASSSFNDAPPYPGSPSAGIFTNHIKWVSAVLHHVIYAICGEGCCCYDAWSEPFLPLGAKAPTAAEQHSFDGDTIQASTALESALLGKLLTPEKLEETVAAGRRSRAPPRTDVLSQLARAVYGEDRTPQSSPVRPSPGYRPPRPPLTPS